MPPPSKSDGSKTSTSSSSTVYTVIFFLAFVTWFIARKQDGYSKWIEHSRAQEWVTAEGIQHRRQISNSDGSEGEANGDESLGAAEGDSSSSSSSSGEKDGAKEKDDDKGEKDDAEGDGGDDESAISTDTAPKIDEMERAREELAILERAVAARTEEERLYTELMNTRTIQGQLLDPPPPGPADFMFMTNIERELATLTQKWIDEFAQIKALQRDPDEAKTADDTMKKLADWQDRWEKRELDRLLQERKEKIGFTTLTGRVASSAGRVENTPRGGASKNVGSASKESPAQKAAAVAAEEGDVRAAEDTQATAAATLSGGVEGKDNDYGIDAATPHRVVVPHLTGSGNPLSESDSDELLATLRSLETNAMQWTESSKKQIVVLGEKVYISRDMGVYKWAFTRLGFNVRLGASSTGRMSTKLLASGDWSVLLCLALNTEHCFTSTNLDRTKRYQRINRVQGLRRVLWSKDSFCETVSSSARGSVLFGKYIFDCWIFPREYTAAAAYAQSHPKSQFIVKPLSMGGGMGISVVDGERGLHKVRRQTHIVQNYLHNPMLINGKKWDLRTYVLVTSVLPLRGYVYNRGLVRFASQVYDPSAKNGGKRTQFLTNTSVNKHYVRKGDVTDITWAFEKLQEHLDSKEPGTYNRLMTRMQAAISIVMLSAERSWRKYFDGLGGEMCGNCYQLMGVDLIVDADLQPRVIEVNGQPSMQLTKREEDHYTMTKRNMIRDLTTLVYNEDRVAADLTKELSSLDREIVTQLQTRDHEYLLEYHRERQAMGGWLPVYPSFRHYHLHEAFFKYQKNPATEESRMTLHHILGALEQRLFDSGGPKPREQRTHSSQSDDEEDGPVIEDEGVIEEGGDVDDESSETAGDD